MILPFCCKARQSIYAASFVSDGYTPARRAFNYYIYFTTYQSLIDFYRVNRESNVS